MKFFILAISFLVAANYIKPLEDLTGIYQNCDLSCESISIYSDSTFEYKNSGGLHPGESAGKITLINENTYLANSFLQPNPAEEKFILNRDYITVVLKDTSDSPLRNAQIALGNFIDTLYAFTNEKGIAHFEHCFVDNISINLTGFTTTNYKLKNVNSNFVKIKLREAPDLIYITNQEWQIKDDTLMIGRNKHILTK